jgi:hypothetical protein
MGCPGLEPGTRRMKVDAFSFIYLNKKKNTSSQTVLAIFIAHGFLYVFILFYLFSFFEINMIKLLNQNV